MEQVMTTERRGAKLLGVATAAQRLGVSAATLRRWANEGVVVAVRLPRSGHRRFTETEIERVRREMGLED